ncbi:MAG: DUF3014 domain-containing protein [Acidobacteria bacterium]|nr:DUF3014 domain-containing protein [Acidobacteriota bacterium]
MTSFDDPGSTEPRGSDTGLADRPLDQTGTHEIPAEARRKPRWGLLIAGAVVALVLIALAYAYLLHRQPEPPPETAAAAEATPTPAPAPPAASEPDVELPAVDASDGYLRDLAGQLSSNPQLATWLGADSLARRFVASIDNIADGTNPATHLGFLRPSEPFQVMEKDGLPHIDPQSYHRFDTVARVFASIDSERAAQIYRRVKPLLQTAYRDLGYPDTDFDETLRRAIRRLRSTPVPEGPVALTPRVVTYAYSDPELESLSGAQRALLRMGPENERLIQVKLGELQRALGL